MLRFNYPKILERYFNTKNEITEKLATKSDTTHGHGNITKEGKLSSADAIVVTDSNKKIDVVDTISKAKIRDFNHNHNKVDISDFNHTHLKSDITNFSHNHNKADISDFNHSHTKSDISNFSHNHNKADISDFNHTHLKSDISNFAHSHVKNDISDFNHSHTKSDITDFNHNHNKADISDLYNYQLSLSNYNPNAAKSQSTTLTVKVTTQNNNPVNNHNITVYKNGESYVTGKTNNNGIFTTTFTPVEEGLITFSVNTHIIQCNCIYDTGWVNITSFDSAIFYGDTPKPKVRRIGEVVQIIGAVKSKTTFPMMGWTDFINIFDLPDSRFAPSTYQSFKITVSKGKSATLRVNNDYVLVGQFSESRADGSYTIQNGEWFPIYVTYFVG